MGRGHIYTHRDYYTESAQWADSVKSEMALLYRRSQSSLLSGKIKGSQTHVYNHAKRNSLKSLFGLLNSFEGPLIFLSFIFLVSKINKTFLIIQVQGIIMAPI